MPNNGSNKGSAKGAVAAGHSLTANVAAEVMAAGGNAVDAALAATAAACVCEPVLASYGGGGFLMLMPPEGPQKAVLCDFFTQTPRQKRPPHDAEFYPITADFGTVTQEFHIGMGAMATPGLPRGISECHRRWGRMPLLEVLQPAIDLARNGAAINSLQSYVLGVVQAIFTALPESRMRYASADQAGSDLLALDPAEVKMLQPGETLQMPDFADFLEVFGREGARFFYEGEPAQALTAGCRENGGHLTAQDLKAYEVRGRDPLHQHWREWLVLTNPPPSTGGILIAFALALLEQSDWSDGWGQPAHLTDLLKAMSATNLARQDSDLVDDVYKGAEALLSADFIKRYKDYVAGHPLAPRGTTHISVIDRNGMAASLTLSNGEGNGWLLPGTGIMMNNMLGEEDINPHGFNVWPLNTRMSSMMAPSLLLRKDGSVTALGSGGSNRIRTAILQTLLNLMAFNMPLEEAINAARIHFENGVLGIEPGFSEYGKRAISELAGTVNEWQAANMFFGGVHGVSRHPGVIGKIQVVAAGDPRRGGAAVIV